MKKNKKNVKKELKNSWQAKRNIVKWPSCLRERARRTKNGLKKLQKSFEKVVKNAWHWESAMIKCTSCLREGHDKQNKLKNFKKVLEKVVKNAWHWKSNMIKCLSYLLKAISKNNFKKIQKFFWKSCEKCLTRKCNLWYNGRATSNRGGSTELMFGNAD